VNWATGYDANGRPIEIAEARVRDKAFDSVPGPFGAHNWHPMSFNPQTGLVYIPAQNVPLTLMEDANWTHNSNIPGQFNSGIGWNTAMAINAVPPTSKPFGKLIAWDPVKQQEAWNVEHVSPWNGGTLTTAGNLVFQGLADGRFVAFNARTGEKLWESSVGTGIVAGPATYLVDGVQYVSIAVGWGGVFGISERITDKEGPGTVFTFAIGGKAQPPEFSKVQLAGLISGIQYNKDDVGAGTLLYVSNCVGCHGIPGGKGGNVKNLGYVAPESITNLEAILFRGPHRDRGMPDFTGKLKPDDVTKIKAFIAGTADAIRPKQ
jgi:quinohemoprotein ethanol dehydrogenase